ncbi:MAG: DUF5654 family protein [Patescibacteria group bacterium]
MGFFKKETKLTLELRERVAGYLIAAFGFVAGLAWNDAIRSLIDELFPVSTNSLIAKFLYAVLVTVVVVFVSMYVIRFIKKEDKNK